jgi:hypothetical protein
MSLCRKQLFDLQPFSHLRATVYAVEGRECLPLANALAGIVV